jgi:hypothetical protein
LARSVLIWSLLGVLLLALTLRTNLFRPTIRGLQVAAEIVQRSIEYREQVRANDALQQELAFLQTEPGRQWAVHKYIGMVKPGEQVGQTVDETQPKAAAQTRADRVRLWFAEREARSTGYLHRMGQAATCYAGLRPPDQPLAAPPAPGGKVPHGSNQKSTTLSKQGNSTAIAGEDSSGDSKDKAATQ